MRAELERCQREGTPRPESSAVRAHVPAVLLGVRAVLGGDLPQRRLRSRGQGTVPRLRVPDGEVRVLRQPAVGAGQGAGPERGPVRRPAQLREVRAARPSGRRPPSPTRRRSPGGCDTDDAFWERLNAHFSEPELVELGCFIALTMGQQSWLRLLNIEHHQVLPGTAASMAPGFETPEALAAVEEQPATTGPTESAGRRWSDGGLLLGGAVNSAASLSQAVDRELDDLPARIGRRRPSAPRRQRAGRRTSERARHRCTRTN